MKIAILKYATHNIGDDIQALAMERLLPRVDLRVDRDDLSPAAQWDDSVRLIVNGWFAKGMHKLWPVPGRARVLYIGFHATGEEALPPKSARTIGCRDPWTASLAQKSGLDGWISYCPTLTLSRPYVQRNDSILLVDVPDNDVKRLPREIAAHAQVVSNIIPTDTADRLAEAQRRLELFARARWVITTRLHALLPCAAMDTPVVFIKPPHSENRYAGYLHLAWRIADAPWDNPKPKCDPGFSEAMTAPLRLVVRRFIES